MRYLWAFFICLFPLIPCFSNSIDDPLLSKLLLESNLSSKNLSLVFASQNPHDPESSFGHIFLAVHDGAEPAPDSVVIEFFGIVETTADLIKTVTSSVSGNYRFQRFSYRHREYNLEDRDLYFFRLNVSPSELKSLISRAASETQVSFPYTFVKKNCAYYLARLLVLEGISDSQILERSIIRPIDTVRFLLPGRKANHAVIPSSHRVFTHYQKLVPDADKERLNGFFAGNFLFDSSLEISDELRDATSAYIRYRLPKEPEAWRRQHLAAAQKHVWHDMPTLEVPAFDKSTKGHWFLSSVFGNGYLLRYQPELQNFFNQKKENFQNSYLDVFSAEIAIREKQITVSELVLFRSEAISAQKEKSRLVDIFYRDWSGKTGENQKEAAIAFGLGWAGNVGKVQLGLIPYLALGFTNLSTEFLNAKAGAKFISEFQQNNLGFRLSFDKWENSPFDFSRENKYQIRWELNRQFNLGWELTDLPDLAKKTQRLLASYSF